MGRERYWSRHFAQGTAEKDRAGCMSGMLQLFDFHQFQCFSLQQQQQQQLEQKPPVQPQKDPPALKKHSLPTGMETPRNSLELEVDTRLSSTSAVLLTEDDVPIGIQVRPGARRSMEKDQSPETSSSQGSKTPNLVARLMGLELLPDQVSSPPMHKSSSFSSPVRSFHHQQQPQRQQQSRRTLQRRDVILPVKESSRYDSGVRSLPDTPRISSSRRSDAERRFSLQLNKENIDALEFNCLGRNTASTDVLSTVSPFALRKMRAKDHLGSFENENKSPGAYAREIAKQLKENVGRRVGIDITNVSSRHRSSDENLTATNVALNVDKCRRLSKGSEDSKQDKAMASASSPRLRFLETKCRRSENKEQSCFSTSPNLPPFQHSPSPLSATLAAQLPTVGAREAVPKLKPKLVLRSTTKCKKASCERFTQRPAAASLAAGRKCTTPLSNTLVQIHPPLNLIRNQAQTVVSAPLPSESSQTKYDQQQKPKAGLAHQGHIEDADAEHRYVRAILDQASATASAPLRVDPSLFLQLELSFDATSSGPLKLRPNRCLLFHLVGLLLLDSLALLLPRHPLSPPSQEADEILRRLRSFPQAKCDTLQDIDALVGLDLAGGCGEGEESEEIVAEVESQILDALVHEALLVLVAARR